MSSGDQRSQDERSLASFFVPPDRLKFFSPEFAACKPEFGGSPFGSPLGERLEPSLGYDEYARAFCADFPSLELEELAPPPAAGADEAKASDCTPRTVASLGAAEDRRCNCKKSQCLRLHCVCFSDGGYCGPWCGCADCLNARQFEDARQFVIRKTAEINPLAFRKKVQALDAQRVVNAQGCRCSRNNCRKNYCDCFKHGIGCTSVCKCSACQNHKTQLNSEELGKVPPKVFRKKHKIVISGKQECGDDPKFCTRSISFVAHKKRLSRKKLAGRAAQSLS